MSLTFACFIEDRRYSVPTLRFLETDGDAASLRGRVRRELLSSENHQAIEVRAERGEVILRETRNTQSSARRSAGNSAST